MNSIADLTLQAAPYVGSIVASVFMVSLLNAWQMFWRSRTAIGQSPASAFGIALAMGVSICLGGQLLYASGLLKVIAKFGTAGNVLANALGGDTTCMIAALAFWLCLRLVLFRSTAVPLKFSYALGSLFFGLICGEAGSGMTHYVDSTISVFGL